MAQQLRPSCTRVELGFDVRDATAARDALASAGSATSLGRALRQGSEGADVRFVQRRLVALGYPLDVDASAAEIERRSPVT